MCPKCEAVFVFKEPAERLVRAQSERQARTQLRSVRSSPKRRSNSERATNVLLSEVSLLKRFFHKLGWRFERAAMLLVGCFMLLFLDGRVSIFATCVVSISVGFASIFGDCPDRYYRSSAARNGMAVLVFVVFVLCLPFLGDALVRITLGLD